jgi:hypothetical protein
MNAQMKDHPNVVIFPPLIPIAILLAACALQYRRFQARVPGYFGLGKQAASAGRQ